MLSFKLKSESWGFFEENIFKEKSHPNPFSTLSQIIISKSKQQIKIILFKYYVKKDY